MPYCLPLALAALHTQAALRFRVCCTQVLPFSFPSRLLLLRRQRSAIMVALSLAILLPADDFAWQQVTCAARLAALQLNGTLAHGFQPAPVKSAIAAGLHVDVPVVYDNKWTRRETIRGYRQAQVHVDAIVGTALSSNAQIVSLLGGVDHLPNVAVWSSAPELSDKSIYPLYARTYPSDAATCRVTVAVVRAFGWRNIGLLHIADAYGEGFRTQLVAPATDLRPLTSGH